MSGNAEVVTDGTPPEINTIDHFGELADEADEHVLQSPRRLLRMKSLRSFTENTDGVRYEQATCLQVIATTAFTRWRVCECNTRRICSALDELLKKTAAHLTMSWVALRFTSKIGSEWLGVCVAAVAVAESLAFVESRGFVESKAFVDGAGPPARVA